MDEELKAESLAGKLKAQHDACHGTDFYSCEEAVKRLNDYLDHELTESERQVVIKHLEICKPCLRRFTFEHTLVISLRQKIARLCAPAPLRAKLHILLHQDKE